MSPRTIGKNGWNGFGVYDKNTRKYYVTLRGCKDIEEIVYCIDTRIKKPFANKDLLINEAVWNKYEEIREEIGELVKDARDVHDIEQIVYSGHSLGGALSQMCALMDSFDGALSNVMTPDSACVSFGAPYVGNKEFKNESERNVKDNMRVIVKQDIIPKLKFNNALVHAGKEVSLSSSCTTAFPLNIYDHHTSVNYLKGIKMLT